MDQDGIAIGRALARSVGLVRAVDDRAARALARVGATCRVEDARLAEVTLEVDDRGVADAGGEGEVDVVVTLPGGHEVHDTWPATFAATLDGLGLPGPVTAAVDVGRFLERAA